MPNVTFCFDFAFLKHVTFKDFFGTGAYLGGPGSDCLDVVYDIPLVGQNKTPYTIDDSTDVTVTNGDISGI